MLAVFESLCPQGTGAAFPASAPVTIPGLATLALLYARAGRSPSLRDLMKWAARCSVLPEVIAAQTTDFLTEKVRSCHHAAVSTSWGSIPLPIAHVQAKVQVLAEAWDVIVAFLYDPQARCDIIRTAAQHWGLDAEHTMLLLTSVKPPVAEQGANVVVGRALLPRMDLRVGMDPASITRQCALKWSGHSDFRPAP